MMMMMMMMMTPDGGGDCNSTTKLLDFLKAIFTKKTSLSGSCLSSSRK